MQSIAPAELGDRKAGLVSDMQSCKQLKVKKTRNVQACSLFSLSSLFSGKEKGKTYSSLPPFIATCAMDGFGYDIITQHVCTFY